MITKRKAVLKITYNLYKGVTENVQKDGIIGNLYRY